MLILSWAGLNRCFKESPQIVYALREAAKNNGLFLVARPLRGGGGDIRYVEYYHLLI